MSSLQVSRTGRSYKIISGPDQTFGYNIRQAFASLTRLLSLAELSMAINRNQILRLAFIVAIFATTSTGQEVPSEKAKDIVVDKTKFSDLYPSVWFSPSTGEITSLKEKSEVPPEKKYKIWIEPGDPEFALLPDSKVKDAGFQLLGYGEKTFNEAATPKTLELSPELTKLLRDSGGAKLPVFYFKTGDDKCFLMITSVDKEKEVIRFRWRLE